METVDGKRVRYLGDGAYISVDSFIRGGYVVTANDHDPEKATDKVHLGHMEMRALIGFVTEVEKANESPEKTPPNQGG